MTEITKYVPESLACKVREQHSRARARKQSALERSVGVGDAFDTDKMQAGAATGGDAKPHGPLTTLPWSVRAKQTLVAANNAMPGGEQIRHGLVGAAKFAGAAIPCAVVGGLTGIGTQLFTHGMYTVFRTNDMNVDLHYGAHPGVAAGLAVAGLASANRFDLAAVVSASMGGGFGGSVLGGFLGMLGTIGLAGASLSLNAVRWYVGVAISNRSMDDMVAYFSPLVLVGGTVGIALGAVGAGMATHLAIRDRPAAEEVDAV